MIAVPDKATLAGAVERHSQREDELEHFDRDGRHGAGHDAGRDRGCNEHSLTEAEGWSLLRRKIGWTSPRERSQSLRNPPAMTERVRAHTRPI